ncbi:MAG: putative negative regulator of RcsB-dependent stress response [Lentisphaeria bacterium]
MADHLTEEEQIEALKSWWKAYWKSVVLPIVVVALGYYGWNEWQHQKQVHAEEASLRYQELVESLQQDPSQTLNQEQKVKAQLLAEALVKDFSGSLYADQAHLALANLALEDSDYPSAEGHLSQVVEDGANNGIKALAATRLARVKLASGDYDGAIALVSSAAETAFISLFAEIRGDALTYLGQAAAARTAYQEAIDNLDPQLYKRRSLLTMKLDGAEVMASVAQPSAESTPADEQENALKEAVPGVEPITPSQAPQASEGNS